MAFKKKTAESAAETPEVKEEPAAEQVADIPTVEEAKKLTIGDFKQCLIEYGVKKTEDLKERTTPMTTQEIDNLNALVGLYQAVNVKMD